MTKRLVFFAASGLLALACSSAETPSDKGAAGTTSMSTAGKPGSGGTGGTGGTTGGSAGTTAMGTGGAGTGGTTGGTAGMATTGGSGGTSGAPGSGGVSVMAGSGGTTPMAGSSGAGAPTSGGAGGGSGSGGASGAGAAGGAGGQGAGGAAAGAAGSGMGGMAGGGSSTASYTCNLVLGIDSTSEWFTTGFETQVTDGKWELIYFHPGYVQDWENPNDAVYTKAVTSGCTMNSTSPDRIILNLFADGADTTSTKLTDQATWVTGLNKAIATLKGKYPNVKRIDLMTMMRGPNNMPCVSTNRSGSVVETYTDDAIAAVVAAATGTPQIVASPKFFAKDCTIFQDGGPHFTDPAGKMAAAKIYGDYYSTEP